MNQSYSYYIIHTIHKGKQMNSLQSRRWSSVGSVLLGFVLSVTTMTVAQAQDRTAGHNSIPAKIEALRLSEPQQIEHSGTLDALYRINPDAVGEGGKALVIVKLRSPSVAEMGDNRQSARMSRKVNIESEQAALIQRFGEKAASMTVVARTQLVLNAIFVEVDVAMLPQLAQDPAVARIAPVGSYDLDLSETVPYIGASAVQAAGFDGSGVSVAILDSGIDYLHRNMGGSGDVADFNANDPTVIEPGTFPTSKVVGGYDFVGENWPNTVNGVTEPDPDPLDKGIGAGHGSHVADIVGGVGADNGGPANGVAPGADLYAVKVCSAVSSSCSGVALIQGMEFAVDPNGDGDPSDHVDIINMSLGSNYGQAFDDDLSLAVDNATALGVLTVSSAGNCGDNPYCTGSPSSAPTALSVAQTEVPSAFLPFINVDGVDYASAFQAWSTPPASIISAPVQYGDGAGGNLNGCAAFAAGSLAGKIVLVDRGACNFSLKIQNVEAANGEAGIIGLIAAGAPFSGGFGGGPLPGIPGYMITQADSNAIKAQIGGPGIGTIDPTSGFPLIGFTVGSTARGPDMSANSIKPEIGAPGASLSLLNGTGTGESTFGGTSGASPMVAGSAALLQDACRDDDDSDDDNSYDDSSDDDSDDGCSPRDLKAMLVNNGYRDIVSDTTGNVAEVTRIGGGEVRVDASLNAPFMAYVHKEDQPTISLGQLDGSKSVTMKRRVRIENLSNKKQTITVTPTFRSAAGSADGAIQVDTRSKVTIGKDEKAMLNVNFHIDASLLNPNAMNSGSDGNNQAALGFNEIAGYLLLSSNDGEIALPWHVLARQAADVHAARQTIVPGGFPDVIGLANHGAGTAQNDAYTIVGLSDEIPRGSKGAQSPTPDLKAVGVTTIPVPAGFCSGQASFLWVFAINTWERQSHLVPVSHQIGLDIDQDGLDDYLVLNRDFTLNNVTDGRQLSWVVDLSTGSAGAFFFAEHATNTGNTAMIICGEQVGLTGTDMLATNVNVNVTAQDFYFGGPGDFIDGITITPLGEGFFGSPDDVPAGGAGLLNVFDYGPFPGNSPEAGVMLFTNGDRGAGARGGATEETEALLFLAPGVAKPQPLSRSDHDDDDDSD